MNSIKRTSPATFAAGMIAGTLLTASFVTLEQPGRADAGSARTVAAAGSPFPDVPARHWAAKSVATIKAAGIAKGAATGAEAPVYNGNSYVTRYEAAVLLDRFVHYVERGRQPLHATKIDPKLMPHIPAGWAHDEVTDLVQNRYISPDNPLLTAPGNSPVQAGLMSASISQAAERVADRSLKPDPDSDEDQSPDTFKIPSE